MKWEVDEKKNALNRQMKIESRYYMANYNIAMVWIVIFRFDHLAI